MADPFGGTFSGISSLFQQYGLLDVLLPFLLVFTIIFAVLQKSKILGEKKQFNVIIALVVAITFIAPHISGGYPTGYDPVLIVNQALPGISLVAVAVIMLLLLLGIFGAGFLEGAIPLIAIAAVAFVVWIFGSAAGFWTNPTTSFYWWTPELTQLLIVIAVFGLIVWWITKEDGKGSFIDKIAETAKKIVGPK